MVVTIVRQRDGVLVSITTPENALAIPLVAPASSITVDVTSGKTAWKEAGHGGNGEDNAQVCKLRSLRLADTRHFVEAT